MDPMHNEKEKVPFDDVAYDSNGSRDADFESAPPSSGGLARELKGRHMQMIAIGKNCTMALAGDEDKNLADINSQVVRSEPVFSSGPELLSNTVVPAAS